MATKSSEILLWFKAVGFAMKTAGITNTEFNAMSNRQRRDWGIDNPLNVGIALDELKLFNNCAFEARRGLEARGT